MEAIRNAQGSLDALIRELRTVEAAHELFRSWFNTTERVRSLNAADAARLLARSGFLSPESRPLLARGALRGAALVVDGASCSFTIERIERRYDTPAKRRKLEEAAADFAHTSMPGWIMGQVETWFCEVHKENPVRA